MNRLSRILCAALFVAAWGYPLAQAQVPMQVSYQGYLTSNTSVPVNTPTNLTFRLYPTQGATTALWTETHASVPVANGVYSVMLGAVNPLDLSTIESARYLSVQAGSDAEMTPRQALGSAPFAAIAQQASTLSGSATVSGAQITGSIAGSQISGTITGATISGGTLTQLDGRYGVASNVQAPQANTITSVDTSGSAGYYTSITLGADGLPVISYRDSLSGLKVAKCGNAACSSGNTITAVEAGNMQHTSIAIGADALPVISYYDGTNLDLKVAKCGNAACSSGNTITAVDTAGTVGQWNAITIGADGLPVISYFDGNADLKVAKCGNAACSSGNTITSVDTIGSVGWMTSIAIGADGLPVISYYDDTNIDLKVAKCGNAACSSGNTITSVDTVGNVGQYPSITIGADGLPVISYQDLGNLDLKVAKCGNAACSSGTTITSVDTVGNVGYYTSIAIGADALPVISYYTSSTGDLKVAKCGNAACSAGNTITAVDTTGAVGQWTSITISADGLPVISYQDLSNFHLKVAKCANAFCAPYFRRR